MATTAEGHQTSTPRAGVRQATVVAVDARPIVRAGLEVLLGGAAVLDVQSVCGPEDASAAIEEHLPAVLVVSVGAEDPDPFQVVATAKALHPALHVLVLTDGSSVIDLREGVAAGADSFLLTTASLDEIADGVIATARGERAVSPAIAMQLALAWRDDRRSAGGSTLSARELEVVACMADGMTNQQVAEQLGLSARTVKTHVQNVLVKLDAADRTGAVATALRQGLIR